MTDEQAIDRVGIPLDKWGSREIATFTQMRGSMSERYGNRRVAKMRAEIETLRRLIRAEGTPAIQDAFDAVEEHLDYAYRPEAFNRPDAAADRG